MRIKEVESIVGITQKNIRFYEKEGLLSPSRQRENGYRTFTQEDVARLQRIKLLRKLDVSLEDIAQMLDGQTTLAMGMAQHLEVLSARKKSLDFSVTLANQLAARGGLLADLDAAAELSRMEHLEQEGVQFVNIQENDKKRRSRGAVTGAALFIGIMALVEMICIWAIMVDPVPTPVLPIMAIVLAAPLVFVVATLVVLRQRLNEIEEDEIDDYRNY